MEDFGDILYILAMLAALVFSAIKKSKQTKKRPAAPTERPADSFDPMEDEISIENLRDLFKPQQPKPAPVVAKPKPKPFQPIDRKLVTHTKKQAPLQVIDLEDETEGGDFNTEAIDLRQAVIYSEILKRPYQ